jgi:adenylate cyclase
MRYPVAEARETFLFVDLVGFTTLAAEQGDDRAADVALDLCDRVRGQLAAHRAEEVKALGDGLMLRCSEPALAVRMAIRIVADLEDLPGFPPVRVGVHTGSAVSRDGDWYGTAVNIAARLCSAAAGGEALVSDSTLRAAGRLRDVDLGEPRLHWLKNLREPVSAQAARRRQCLGSRIGRRRVPGGLFMARAQEVSP